MNFDGYDQAVIHLAWFRDDKIRHLLFAMVELRPTEFCRVPGCPTKNARVGNKGRRHIHYRRFALSVSDAISWYTAAFCADPVLPADPDLLTPGDGMKLLGGPFFQEPPWPALVTSNELAFAPDWMQGSRAHFLFPKNPLASGITGLISDEKIRTKLSEWMNFDMVDIYSEYQGAICLVAPNPLFRSIAKSHLEQPGLGDAETVAYKIVPRKGQSLAGLRLEVVNERLRGRMDPFIHPFGSETTAIFQSPAKIYREGRSVTHPEHGLLSWREPGTIIRKIRVGFEVASRRKSIQVPRGGRKRPAHTYEVDELEDAGEAVTGDALDDSDIVSRLAAAKSRRASCDYDQQWFHDDTSKAEKYVRQKIGDARDEVLIVDPYFAGRELLQFGHAIRRTDVQLRILTSAQGLKASGQGAQAGKESELQLLDYLNQTFTTYRVKPEIRVLSGKKAAVHDRFLVVDENVWFSGNSLNTIGERASMIVRLPSPAQVILRLEEFWQDAPALSEWLSSQAATPKKCRLRSWLDRLAAWIPCR